MSTWLLILIVYSGSNGGIAIQTIPFSREFDCRMAARDIRQEHGGDWRRLETTCVEKTK